MVFYCQDYPYRQDRPLTIKVESYRILWILVESRRLLQNLMESCRVTIKVGFLSESTSQDNKVLESNDKV